MNRRTFFAASAISATAIATYTLSKGDSFPSSIADMVKKLRSMELTDFKFSGDWNNVQVFNHLAQSIEFSMLGYPEHKSTFFKHTVGKLAFSAFQHMGKMTHNLAEAIPGAPDLEQPAQLSSAYQRLITALLEFDSYEGLLEPHFAYGQLNKADYAQAHILHIYNHFELLHSVHTADP